MLTGPGGSSRTFAELGVPLRSIANVAAAGARGASVLAGDTRGWLHQLGADGGTVAAIRAHRGAITAIAIAPDRTWITGSEDGYVKRWREGREVSATRCGDFVTSVAIDARGDLTCAGYDGAIRIVR